LAEISPNPSVIWRQQTRVQNRIWRDLCSGRFVIEDQGLYPGRAGSGIGQSSKLRDPMYDYSNLIAAIVGIIVVGGAIWGTAFWDRRTRKMQADYAESLRKTEEFQREYLELARESQRFQADSNAAIRQLIEAIARNPR